MTKQLSKRISERKKTKVARKNIRREKKIRKEQKKKQRGLVKVPKSYLLSEEEKEHLKSIREATQQRTQEYQSPESCEPAHILDLKKCLLEHMCDTFIEVVDFRDIEGSRNKSAEDLLKKNGKEVYVFINFSNGMFDADLCSLQNDGLTVLHDLGVLSNSKKLCIFGNRKSGKFLLSKSIEALCVDTPEFEFIRTPSSQSAASGVLRGHLGLDDINPVVVFNQIWKFINQEEIKKFYMLGSFDGPEAFLDVLADKVAEGASSKKSLSSAALQFFKDAQMGKIAWMKRQGCFHFKFIFSQ